MEKHSARFPFCSSLVNVIFHRLPSRDASVITLYKSAQLPQRNLYRQQKVVSQGDFHLLPGIYLEHNLTGSSTSRNSQGISNTHKKTTEKL